MRKMVDEGPVLDSPFFGRIGRAPAERALLLGWALQDRYTSYVFPRLISYILAGLAGDTPDICDVRIPIAENLWEELGEGRHEQAHSTLMDALIRSLGIADEELIAPQDEATRAMLDTQLDLCREDPVAGLGAFCYGNEYLALREYTPIKRAVMTTFERPDVRFFDANHEADGRHTRLLEAALEALCAGDPAMRLRCQYGASLALSVRRSFYDALCTRFPAQR